MGYTSCVLGYMTGLPIKGKCLSSLLSKRNPFTLCIVDELVGLLAGTMRRHLLEAGELHERIITVDELKEAARVSFSLTLYWCD